MLLILTPEENQSYLGKLKDHLAGHKVKIFTGEVATLTQLTSALRAAKETKVITTREDILKLTLPPDRQKQAKIDNYAGSVIPLEVGQELLVVNPLKQTYSVPYGDFILGRFISKFTKPEKWNEASKFNWQFLEDSKIDDCLADMDASVFTAVDIETSPGLRITSIAYCCLFADGSTRTWGRFVDSLEDVKVLRRLNAHPCRKVLQNGKYDCAYLHLYSAPLTNYLLDTLNMMHAWFAEMPKDLAYLQAFFVRDAMYWKDLAESNDPTIRMEYNCRDVWATVEVAKQWLKESPEWAKKNYIHEFTQVPICFQMEMRGIKRDLRLLERYAIEDMELAAKDLRSLQLQTNVPNFNPSSPVQTVKLLQTLGYRWKPNEKPSSSEAHVKSAILLHPLNERILGSITRYRETRKEFSTYLCTGEDAKEYRSRILYTINPSGTDTGRKSSRESNLSLADAKGKWKKLGLQVQNIPGDSRVKDTFVADDGFLFAEIDKSQAEARGVAYCSGDAALLQLVESSHDFHSWNASAFFGVPYEEIYDELTKTQLNKPLRNLSKRVNHGANYNMGAAVLLATMGERAVREAQKLLSLPKHWTLFKVCEYLLHVYEKTYPQVKGLYYEYIKREVKLHSMLTGATGWTRYCFGKPWANKPDLNAYVAHVTQSLNAMDLDLGITKVFNEFGFDPDIKLLAQIHDSLLLQYREGCEEKVDRIAKLLLNDISVTDCKGVTRTMVVPVDVKLTGKRWSGKDVELATAI